MINVLLLPKVAIVIKNVGFEVAIVIKNVGFEVATVIKNVGFEVATVIKKRGFRMEVVQVLCDSLYLYLYNYYSSTY